MKTVEEVQAMLDEKVNNLLGQHRGRVEITRIHRTPTEGVAVHVTIAYVKMIGGCQGCPGAKYTLSTIIASNIKGFDPTIDHVVDITDHTDKSEAFYKE